MRRTEIFLVVLSLLLLALPVVSQEEPGPITRVFVDKAKTGMEQQYEEAVKQHIAWHREQGDTWSWEVRRIESGENFGQYLWITRGHRWEDFDNPEPDNLVRPAPARGRESLRNSLPHNVF